jgi:hypothetical protein
MENNMEVPQKIKISIPYDSVIPVLGIYPKEMKSIYQKDSCVSMFIEGLFPIVMI